MPAPREKPSSQRGSAFDSAPRISLTEPVLDALEVFDAVAAQLRREHARVPRATYRVQFHAGFTFEDARARLDYLRALGVSDLYASPFLRARPGSTHGYDIVAHDEINPALGGAAALERLSAALRERAMGLLVDTVPNHMGVGDQNAYWADVLENGQGSQYASFFDIDWAPLKSELQGKVLLPVLADHYGRVLDRGDLRIEHERGSFVLRYFQNTLPINPRTYPVILGPMLPGLIERLGETDDAVLELQSILTGLGNLPSRNETRHARVVERRREKEILRRRLATLVEGSPVVAEALSGALGRVNGTPNDPRSFDALDRLLEDQCYRLSYWRVAGEEINYRRFFDINDMAAIRIEEPAVFARAHALLFELLRDDKITGLRIDHPDGLWDPAGYFALLQREFFLELCRRHVRATLGEAGEAEFARIAARLVERFEREREEDPGSPVLRPLYVAAEKILARGERMPEHWTLHGTSGYEFATTVGALFVDAANEAAVTKLYADFTNERSDFDALVYGAKKLVLRSSMASELNVLAAALNRLSERSRYSRDFTLGALTDALREVIAAFPVYRTYVTERTEALDEHDRVAVEKAVRAAARRSPATDASIFGFLRAVLTLAELPDETPEDRDRKREFVMRFQQLTPPVMAKGVEDTAFYVYNRLVALNEVGGEPEHFGASAAAFHRFNAQRQRALPYTLNTTSTHDTKRSEDVRARLAVLSELPERWGAALAAYADATSQFKTPLDNGPAPTANEEYLFYQTLLGVWPFDAPSAEPLNALTERLVDYMRKATREAKVHTSWVAPDADFDAAMERFVRESLAPGSPLIARLAPLAAIVSFHGMFASLSQLALKLCSPGVPDLYQGNELWDFRLVDPDNRRDVDYPRRAALLSEVQSGRARGQDFARELLSRASDGRIKLLVTSVGLELRARLPEVFGAGGEYVPVYAEGPGAEHVVAFARRQGGREVVVVVSRLTARLTRGELRAPVGGVWKDLLLALPAGSYTDALTGATRVSTERDGISAVPMAQVFEDLPVALLVREGG